MPSQRIVLLPPTHEQSLPTFHVEESLLEGFLEFLKARGFKLGQPPEALGRLDKGGVPFVEVELEANTPMPDLERALQDFCDDLGDPDAGE
jgi:hypothetical protein